MAGTAPSGAVFYWCHAENETLLTHPFFTFVKTTRLFWFWSKSLQVLLEMTTHRVNEVEAQHPRLASLL